MNYTENLCQNGRCGGLSMPPTPFFLLPIPGVVVVLLLLPRGHTPHGRASPYIRAGRSHLSCGTKSAVRFCSLTEDWYADTVLVRLQQCGPKGFRRYGNGQQAPGKPDQTRSIAPNQGYICRSSLHEAGGDTFVNLRGNAWRGMLPPPLLTYERRTLK